MSSKGVPKTILNQITKEEIKAIKCAEYGIYYDKLKLFREKYKRDCEEIRQRDLGNVYFVCNVMQ